MSALAFLVLIEYKKNAERSNGLYIQTAWKHFIFVYNLHGLFLGIYAIDFILLIMAKMMRDCIQLSKVIIVWQVLEITAGLCVSGCKFKYLNFLNRLAPLLEKYRFWMQYSIYNLNITIICAILLYTESPQWWKSEQQSSVIRFTLYFEETVNRLLHVIPEELYAEQEVKIPHKYSKIKKDLDKNIKLLEKMM